MNLVIHTDGGARGNPGPAGIGVAVFGESKLIYELASSIGVATNNQAEYQALLESIKWLVAQQSELKPSQVTWKLDSKLVVEQVNKNWKIKLPHLKEMAKEAWLGLNKLECSYKITYIPREENHSADSLVNQALDAQ